MRFQRLTHAYLVASLFALLAAVDVPNALAAKGRATGPSAVMGREADAKKAQCLDNYEAGQRLRQSSRLREAREALVRCAADECPSSLRIDCAQWLGEVEAAIPTVVPSARTSSGDDLVDVRVSIDGAEATTHVDGTAIPVDPGAHRFRFEALGHEPVELEVVVREHEKGRPVEVVFEDEASIGALDVLPWVFGGVGLAGMIVFAGFGLHGRSVQGDLDDQGCKPMCPQEDVDDMERSYLVANVSLVVGLVSLAAAGGTLVGLLLDDPAPDPTAQAGSVSLRLGPTHGGGFVGVQGVF